jgi:hypothetical protein
MEWMIFRKGQRGQAFPPCAVRLVVDRPPPLVLHDVTLSVELLLCHARQEIAHPVRLEPQRKLELVRRDRLVVVRAVEPGRSVQCPARTLDDFKVLVRGDVGRALKQHVLEQMGEPGSPFALVRRSDVIPEVHRNQRNGVVG